MRISPARGLVEREPAERVSGTGIAEGRIRLVAPHLLALEIGARPGADGLIREVLDTDEEGLVANERELAA